MRAHMTDAQFAGHLTALRSPTGRNTRRTVQPLEKDVQATIRDWLKLQGWFVMRVNSGAFMGEHKGKRRFVRFTDRTGVSDLMFAKGPVWGYCEVKRPGSAGATLQQQAFLADVRRHGGRGIVATSVEDVQRELSRKSIRLTSGPTGGADVTYLRTISLAVQPRQPKHRCRKCRKLFRGPVLFKSKDLSEFCSNRCRKATTKGANYGK